MFNVQARLRERGRQRGVVRVVTVGLVIGLAGGPRTAPAQITFQSGQIEFTHTPDLSNGSYSGTWPTRTIGPQANSQFGVYTSKHQDSGSFSQANGIINTVSNSYIQSVTAGPGTGVVQSDAADIYNDFSQTRINIIDHHWNVESATTNPLYWFGGFVLSGVLSEGATIRFDGELTWKDGAGTTIAQIPSGGQLAYEKTGPDNLFLDVVTGIDLTGPGSLRAGSEIHLEGWISYEAKNQDPEAMITISDQTRLALIPVPTGEITDRAQLTDLKRRILRRKDRLHLDVRDPQHRFLVVAVGPGANAEGESKLIKRLDLNVDVDVPNQTVISDVQLNYILGDQATETVVVGVNQRDLSLTGLPVHAFGPVAMLEMTTQQLQRREKFNLQLKYAFDGGRTETSNFRVVTEPEPTTLMLLVPLGVVCLHRRRRKWR